MAKTYALDAIAAAQAAFGYDALHDPDGAATPCLLTWESPEGAGGFFEGGQVINSDGRSATINRVGPGSLPVIANNDLIEVTDQGRWRVIGDPVHPEGDGDRLIWQIILSQDS